MFKNTKIIIIGAGAAGISAAARLIERGLENIIILEGKDRIGGRIHTVEFCKLKIINSFIIFKYIYKKLIFI